jgi:hypothetical protein
MIFRAVMPCTSVGVHRRFGGMYRFHLQVRIIAQEAACCMLLAWSTLWSWRWRQNILAKHQWSTELHGFTTWKIILFTGICCTYRGSNSDSTARSLVTILTELSRLLTLTKKRENENGIAHMREMKNSRNLSLPQGKTYQAWLWEDNIKINLRKEGAY